MFYFVLKRVFAFRSIRAREKVERNVAHDTKRLENISHICLYVCILMTA